MFEYGTKIVLKDLGWIGEVDRCYPEDKEYRIVYGGVKFNIPEAGFNVLFEKAKPIVKQDIIEIPSKPMTVEKEVENINKLTEEPIKKKGWFR